MPKPDYSQIAAAFMDMWQEQLTRSLSDGDMVRRMMEMMRHEPQPARNAAHASGAEPDELDELRERLARCERRLWELERSQKQSAAAAKNKAPAKKRPTTKRAAGTRTSGGDDAVSFPKAHKRKAVKRQPAPPSPTKGKKLPATSARRGKK